MIDAIRLPDLPRALAAQGVSASYITIWRRIVASDIPAHRAGKGWAVLASDLPRIADFFASEN